MNNKPYLLALIALLSISFSNVEAKKKAKIGKEVQIIYTGTVDNGMIFDSNLNGMPLKFTLGDQTVLKAFEDGVLDMKVGETKNINIPADYAYGQVYPAKIMQIGREQVDKSVELKEGANLKLQGPEGSLLVRVIEISADKVYLDANHLLAGKDLTFEVKLISVDTKKKN